MLFFSLCIRKYFFIIYIFWAQFYRLSPLVSLPRHPKLKVKYNVIKDKASCFPFSRKVKEFYHTRVSRSVCHVFALWALRSFVLLFKVLWSAAPVLMFAAQMQSGPDWNGGGQEERKRGASDRVSGRDGGGEKRVSRGSEWLECAARLSEWAARWAGGDCRYCVEAAGVRVAVTDTKNNISWQETLWPGVDAPAAPLVSTGLFLTLLLRFLSWGLWKNTILWLKHYCNLSRSTDDERHGGDVPPYSLANTCH